MGLAAVLGVLDPALDPVNLRVRVLRPLSDVIDRCRPLPNVAG